MKMLACKQFLLTLLILKLFSGGYQPTTATENILSFSGFCGEGYQGIACKNCIPGYAKFGGRK